jgi:dienelactone hydrolase
MISAADVHWLDRAFGAVLSRAELFSEGWGDAELLAFLSQPVPTEEAPPPALDITWEAPSVLAGIHRRAGSFVSPAAELLRSPATKLARFELLVPSNAVSGGGEPVLSRELPLCLYLASSGEEGFMRRRTFAAPLVRRGIGALILENPFYGRRRPEGQRSAALRSVAEQLAMNRATVRESRALLAHFRARGLERLAVSGYSMGGFMSALTVTRCPFPVAAIPCATGLSPAPVFVEGVLSRSIVWPELARAIGDERAAREKLAGILHAVADYLLKAPRPRAAIIVAAKQDGFVLPRDVEELARAWPQAELRWVGGGHVSAYLRHQTTMRRAIVDAIARLA